MSGTRQLQIGNFANATDFQEYSPFIHMKEGAPTADIDWGDGNIETVTLSSVSRTGKLHKYAEDGIYYVHIQGVVECYALARARTFLTGAYFGDEIEKIGFWSLGNCVNLTEIDLTEATSLTELGLSACCRAGISSISLPDNLKVLDDYAFERCEVLTTIISWNVEEIGEGCFYSCANLKSIPAMENIVEIGAEAFRGLEQLGYSEYGLNPIVLSSNKLESIGNNAFRDCTSIGVVEISDSASNFTIGEYVFAGCTSLQFISLPSNLTNIGLYSFSEDYNISTVEFGWTDPVHSYDEYRLPDYSRYSIPNGSTANYTAKRYPASQLIERN